MPDLIISNVKVATISDEDVKNAIDAMKKINNAIGKTFEIIANARDFPKVASWDGVNFPIKKPNNLMYVEDMVEQVGRNAGDHICNGCDLAGTQCEGSKCGEQAAFYYERLSRQGKRQAYFDTYGKDDFYNLSLRVKVKLLNY